ncbi:MAG: hypothetical protein QOJ12_367 [Thermoleophilales bacterium]|jgi:hypothetical protein|nr:hypothetical protein [Thermoleophilales bacterium]
MQSLKLKVYPLLIAAIGVIAASGGLFRTR